MLVTKDVFAFVNTTAASSSMKREMPGGPVVFDSKPAACNKTSSRSFGAYMITRVFEPPTSGSSGPAIRSCFSNLPIDSDHDRFPIPPAQEIFEKMARIN